MVNKLFSHLSIYHPETQMLFFSNEDDLRIHNSVIYRGKSSDCWTVGIAAISLSLPPSLSPSLLPTLNCAFSSCPPTFVIAWGGGGRDRKSPVELCPEEQSTDTGIHLETSPQTWYTRILDCRGLKSFFFLLIWPPRSFSEVSQEPVLPAAGPQTLRKVVQGLCDCRANVQRVYSTENSTGRGSQFSI